MPGTFHDKLKQLLGRFERSLPAALVNRFIETDLMTQSASLAFYAVLSLAPLLVLLLWLTASLYPSAQGQLLHQIGGLAGRDAEAMAQTVIENARVRPNIGSLAGWWSTLLLFIGATAVFAQLQSSLNLIFRTEAQKPDTFFAWLRKRSTPAHESKTLACVTCGWWSTLLLFIGAISFSVIFALGFLLVVSMTLTTVLQVVFASVPSLLPALGTLASFVVYVVAFACLYHFLPDRRVRWRQAFLGGVITALLFSGGRYLIGLYISTADPGGAYGSTGALVILLVWIYYASVVFFAGALLTAVIDERATAGR
jgi:membrane protein